MLYVKGHFSHRNSTNLSVNQLLVPLHTAVTPNPNTIDWSLRSFIDLTGKKFKWSKSFCKALFLVKQKKIGFVLCCYFRLFFWTLFQWRRRCQSHWLPTQALGYFRLFGSELWTPECLISLCRVRLVIVTAMQVEWEDCQREANKGNKHTTQSKSKHTQGSWFRIDWVKRRGGSCRTQASFVTLKADLSPCSFKSQCSLCCDE